MVIERLSLTSKGDPVPYKQFSMTDSRLYKEIVKKIGFLELLG